MKQQDKLRDTLREYYDNQQVPFDDNEWERASAYLSTARRGRRIRYSVVVLIVLFSALVIGLFNFPEITGNDARQVSSRSKQIAGASPAQPPEIIPAPTPSEQKKDIPVNITPNKDSPQSLHAAVSIAENHRNTPEITAKVSSGKPSAVIESAIAEQKAAPVEPINNLDDRNTIDTNPAVTSTTIATANDNTIQNGISSEAPQHLKENTEKVPVAVENIIRDYDQPRAAEIPDAPGELLPQIVANEEIAVTEGIKHNGSEEKAPVTDTLHNKPVAGASTSTEISVGDTLPKPSLFNQLAGEGIFYEVGATWLYGWKGPSHRDARGFSPVVGVNYINRLSNRCALSFGLQYLQIRNLSNSSMTSRVSTYKYGEQSKVTIITPSTLHYLAIPLRFHYYANLRNSFGAGINLAYLLNVDATVTRYDEKPGVNENYKTVKLGGYTEGFSWFDSQLAFFYRRRIGYSFGIHAEVFIGLTDVKQDGFFGFSNKERNSGAKLSLVYYAFRKKGR